MKPRFDRLLHLGNVVIDIVLDVPALPERGGDVLATSTRMTPGGGFNVLVAAARQGLRAAYAGSVGRGPFGALARTALADAGIEVLQPPKAGIDTGFVVSIVDAGGERTFVTSAGAEATVTAGDLAGISAAPGDAVYLSGYSLLHPGNQAALLDWLGRLDDGNMVFADPGPLGHLIPAAVIGPVMARADWWSCNAREAAALTGCRDPVAAARALAARVGRPAAGQDAAGQDAAGQDAAGPAHPGSGGGLVRTGPAGCLVCSRDAAPVQVPGFPVNAVDTNGAGDAHTGTFIAALAEGADEITAARTANAAAALSVTSRGPATAPTAAELARFLSAS